MQQLGSKNPMNRIGQPDELKGAVALLCSNAGKLHHWAKPMCRWRVGHMVGQSESLASAKETAIRFPIVSIINGYSPEGLAASGWPGIYDYVRRRHASEFGLNGWKVTHAWTQDPEVTKKLCAACRIPNGSSGLSRVSRARWTRSSSPATTTRPTSKWRMPFLEAGMPVFVDKPLSLEIAELVSLQAIS